MGELFYKKFDGRFDYESITSDVVIQDYNVFGKSIFDILPFVESDIKVQKEVISFALQNKKMKKDLKEYYQKVYKSWEEMLDVANVGYQFDLLQSPEYKKLMR